MTLPQNPATNGFLKKGKIESLILPAMAVFILSAILVAGILIPKKNKEQEKSSRDTSVFTASNKVAVHGGKEVEVSPRVKQISAEVLSASLASKEDIIVIHVFSGEEWKEPRIKSSILMKKSDFDTAPTNIDINKKYVYVSADGYDSAEAISKLLNFGYSSDTNVNLEGGLKAWKDKGYELEL